VRGERGKWGSANVLFKKAWFPSHNQRDLALFLMPQIPSPWCCVLCTVYCTLCTVSVCCTLCTVLCALYSVHCTLCLYSVHVYSVHCTLCAVLCVCRSASCVFQDHREFLGSKAFARPQIDIGLATWQTLLEKGYGVSVPQFDPYTYDMDWLIAAFALPYVGLTAYVGIP